MKLFCYGTLMGEALQRGGRPARIYGRLWDNGLYPAARRGKPGGPMVAGVVFEVTAEDLALFDAREGASGNWYRRVKVGTVEGELAWMYEAARCLTDAHGPRSDWRRVLPDEHGVASWDHERPYWRGRGKRLPDEADAV
jgi:gamma-glutamylcyclotransferase (GGCT)/AIG2-like uncharacterized protein YtfP